MDLFDSASSGARRALKPFVVSLSLFVALFLTLSRRGPQGHITIGPEPLAASQKDDRPYDLTALRIFNRSLQYVNDAYVDPTRVDPKQMLLAALDQVQKSVPEVLVEPSADKNSVVVRVETAQRSFVTADVDAPWTLASRMREIFKFIAQNLPPGMDRDAVRNIEYAAVNGMLSTLDPHSTLLDPTTNKEMKLSTRGSFGGLGIVIAIRKGALTVMKPMPGTPAGDAGVKRGDRIVRIGKESTVNMMLEDAVARLRGEPGTKVDLYIEKGSEAPGSAKKLSLTRAEIKVHTITAQMLKNNVGYIRLHTSFAGNSAKELHDAMEDLKAKGMKSLVFDLRSNPGGLLDQAIKVTDEFVDTGTIVSTVGYANKQRKDERATPGGQPHMPMAVLVNHGSASASEIVAGALKNLDRAVVIGTKTFGKGSVQVVYDNDEDGSALKLTIAQYLTPGDVSIQSVGITPDIELSRVAIDKEKGVWLYRDWKGTSEAELDAHLVSKNVIDGDKPFATLKYLAMDAPKKQKKDLLRDDTKIGDDQADDDDKLDDDLDANADDKVVEDFEIQYARDLVAQAKGWHRREVLASSKAYFQKREQDEQVRVTEAVKKLGVDWTPLGTRTGEPALVGSITTDRPKNEAKAGESIKITAKITNKGTGAAGQVRAMLKGDDALFEGREFLFGKIAPGESRTSTVTVKIPKDALTRTDPLTLDVTEELGAKAKLEGDGFTLRLQGPPRPQFSYAYQLVDDVQGNGDGLPQKGEGVRLHVTVRNIGEGRAPEAIAQLRNLAGDGLFFNKGRFPLGAIEPGQSKSMDFTFDVKPELDGDQFRVELSVYDEVLHEYVQDKLSFNTQAPVPTATRSGMVELANDASVQTGAQRDAAVIGTAKKGSVWKATATAGDFVRVELDGRPGYLPRSTVKDVSSGTPTPTTFAQTWQVSPPNLTVKGVTGLVVGNKLRISGTVKDENKVSDVFIFVSNRRAKIDRRKVFYRANRNGHDGKAGKEMSFETEIPLWPGANVVSVVARESAQVQSQDTLIVQRQGDSAVATGMTAGSPEHH